MSQPKHTISHGGICSYCGAAAWYSTHLNDASARGFDALFCEVCDVWLEMACVEPGCAYCADRPPRPSMVALERCVVPSSGVERSSPEYISPDLSTKGSTNRFVLDELDERLLALFNPDQLEADVDAAVRLPSVRARLKHLALRTQERCGRSRPT